MVLSFGYDQKNKIAKLVSSKGWLDDEELSHSQWLGRFFMMPNVPGLFHWNLACERLGVSQDELEEKTGTRDVWAFLLRLLPKHPESR